MRTSSNNDEPVGSTAATGGDPVEEDLAASTDDSEGQIAFYCGSLSCGKVLALPGGRGRPQEFCSETCRREADRDYRRARARVELLEKQLRKAQHHLAACGRRPERSAVDPSAARLQGEVREAFARASVVVELGAAPERAAEELQRLVGALQPWVEAQQ